MGYADHKRGEHQRRDDHLDQPQKDIGHQRNVFGNALCHCRIGPKRVAGVADRDAEQHSNDDYCRQRRAHDALRAKASN
jgi:hypothetical protein